MKFDVFVMGDQYIAGQTEDGPKLSELYYVVVEDENGNRFAHFHSFKGCRVVEDSEAEMGFWLEDVQAEAMKAAERLRDQVQAHLNAGRQLDMYKWGSIDPRYGSDAYASLDSVGYFKAREKREAE